MGYDLKPRNSKLDWFRFGAFSWGWLVDEGIGYVVGHGRGVEPASFFFRGDDKGRSIMYNDGARVTAEEARGMAMVARGIAAVQRSINKAWDEMDTETKARRESTSRLESTYRRPVREDFIDKAERFAEWADQSQGFTVH